MLDKLRQFLDDRGVTPKDFVMVTLAMGFLTATETGAFWKDVGVIALVVRVYTYTTFEGNILELADVLINGSLSTYNTQFFVKVR